MTYKQQERQMKNDIETMKRRFDYDCTTENSTHIRNVLLKYSSSTDQMFIGVSYLACSSFTKWVI